MTADSKVVQKAAHLEMTMAVKLAVSKAHQSVDRTDKTKVGWWVQHLVDY